MLAVLSLALSTAFVTVAAGDPILERDRTTISDEARSVIAKGGQVSCLRDSERYSRIVCLTGQEWRAVADESSAITERNRDRFLQGVARARFIQLGAVSE